MSSHPCAITQCSCPVFRSHSCRGPGERCDSLSLPTETRKVPSGETPKRRRSSPTSQLIRTRGRRGCQRVANNGGARKRTSNRPHCQRGRPGTRNVTASPPFHIPASLLLKFFLRLARELVVEPSSDQLGQ